MRNNLLPAILLQLLSITNCKYPETAKTNAVFFTNENIQEVIKLYGTQNTAMDKLDLQLKDARPNPGSARIIVSSFSEPGKQLIHTVTLGTEECSGKKITSTFYSNGEVFYQELGELRTFFGNFRTSGIVHGMDRSELVKKLGAPRLQTAGAIRYRTDELNGTAAFYFKDNRLFGIRIALPVLCNKL